MAGGPCATFVAVAASAALGLGACADGPGSGATTTSGTGTATTTKVDTAMRCTGRTVSRARDRAGDVIALSATGPATSVRAPHLDILAASATRGGPAPLCFTLRVAAPLRNSTTVSFQTIGRRGPQYALDIYDVSIDAGGRPTVSRPHGEPRYPVAAVVARHGDRLDVALLQLPAPLGARFGWKAETSDAQSQRDGMPSLAADRWVAFPAGRIVDASAYQP